MGIISNADLKDWLKINDAVDDTRITVAVAAANSAVVNYCGRSFDKTDVGSETSRLFNVNPQTFSTWPLYRTIEVDDFWDVTNLVIKTDDGDNGTFSTTWTASDYQVEPLNGRDGPLSVPYYRITSIGGKTFPVWNRRPALKVTAAWGWAAIPDDVRTATLIKAARLYKRKDSPEGVLGGWADQGVVRVTQREDPDAAVLLRPYVRTSTRALVG